jgi:hypothetical protein
VTKLLGDLAVDIRGSYLSPSGWRLLSHHPTALVQFIPIAKVTCQIGG